jgi:hypothetical protein
MGNTGRKGRRGTAEGVGRLWQGPRPAEARTYDTCGRAAAETAARARSRAALAAPLMAHPLRDSPFEAQRAASVGGSPGRGTASAVSTQRTSTLIAAGSSTTLTWHAIAER